MKVAKLIVNWLALITSPLWFWACLWFSVANGLLNTDNRQIRRLFLKGEYWFWED